ncbi:MAG: Cys-Gln thioester bond-forming surface protein, partial [Ruminococcaceae bacterium]|nr:Cys-Gln thioester bond-forming surface protein [Oscillospiraceae bacterium]
MKNIFKRMLSIFLAFVIAFTATGINSLDNVSAASWTSGSSATITVESFGFGYHFSGSGLRYPTGGECNMWANAFPKLSVDGQIAYCIDSQSTQGANGTSTGTVGNAYASDKDISLALAYGYTGTTKYGYSADTERLATQIIIWNMLDGWYDNDSESTALYYFTAEMGDSTLIANVKTVYYLIKNNIKNYNIMPSFNSDKEKMTYNSSTKKWTFTFTDTKGVADQFDWASAVKSYSYLSVEVKSGSVTFTSTKAFDTITLTAAYNSKYFTAIKGVPVTPDYGQTCEQPVVTYMDADPYNATVKLYANEATGELEIKKVAQGGDKVDGITFVIYKSDSNGTVGSYVGMYQTDTNGLISKELDEGYYLVCETSSPRGYFVLSPSKYTPDNCVNAQLVQLEAGGSKTVTFTNYAEDELKIVKTSEDGNVSGIQFKIEYDQSLGNSDEPYWAVYTDGGTHSDGLYTTDSSGEIILSNIRANKYRVTEIVPDGYLAQEPQIREVKYGETTEFSFHNEPETGELKIIKTSENGVVEAFTFYLFKGSTPGNYVGQYTTNETGEILIKDLKPGTYCVTENKKAGYKAQSYQVVTVKYNETAEVEFYNELERGDLKLYKTFTHDDGSDEFTVDGVIDPDVVNDITFTLTGTSTVGETVNESAKLQEDPDGNYYVEFKDILIGTYTLHEELGGTASKYLTPMEDRTVTISYDDEIEVDAENFIKTGNLEFIKIVEYGNVNDIRFNLKGTSDVGIEIDLTVSVTGRYTSTVIPWYGIVNGSIYSGEATARVINGKVVFSNIPVGTYTLTETQCNDYYIVMETKTDVVITAGGTVDLDGRVNGQGQVVNELKRGNLRVYKESENGQLSNILFRLEGTSDSGMWVSLEAYTNSQGIAEFNKVPIGSNYTLTEVNADDYFIPNDPITGIEIVWEEEATEDDEVITIVNVENYVKRGDLELTKTIEISKYAENNSLAGFKFRLYGTSDSGLAVDITETTDENGTITFKNVYIGTYTLEELDTPERYVIPEPQTVTIHWNGLDEDGNVVDASQAKIPAAKATFENILKYWSVTVVKEDSEKGTAQGDATLAGAVYGVYDNSELVDTYTTDVNGTFTTKEYECGYNWTVKEITPSEGYLLDETAYHVGAEPGNYTVPRGNVAPTITSNEDVKKGSFLLLKTTGNGTGIYEFEVGAEFEVYLTSAGSYAAADADERDLLIIGENGTAVTKQLPYGVYTVHQTKGWDGRALCADFIVYVGEENNSYQLIPINNGIFESRIRVVKVDSETGETIPLSGAAFQIYDPEGNLVVQTSTYPEYDVCDTYYTDVNGELVTPEPLAYGIGYKLVEVQAPYGYVLNSEPLYFDVVSSVADYNEEDILIIELTFQDDPQKGIITVNKSGEIFSTVSYDGDLYTPLYDTVPLSGAVYAIYAAEDIYTADGTLRYAKGSEVDRVTTNISGTASSKALYLGTYTVVEIEAPYGMVLNSTPMTAVIRYGEQTVEITDDTLVSFINDRQQIALNMFKVMETNELFGLGMGDEILAVSFGLYAAEDITANDGTVIPK